MNHVYPLPPEQQEWYSQFMENRDACAANKLLQAYKPRIYGAIPTPERFDLTEQNNALIAAWKALHRWDGTSKLETFLY